MKSQTHALQRKPSDGSRGPGLPGKAACELRARAQLTTKTRAEPASPKGGALQSRQRGQHLPETRCPGARARCRGSADSQRDTDARPQGGPWCNDVIHHVTPMGFHCGQDWLNGKTPGGSGKNHTHIHQPGHSVSQKRKLRKTLLF